MNKTKLSVNVNKVATLRNSRGGNTPNVLQVALDCEQYGADGITVHPRPDERHIRYADVYELKQHINTELNLEGYPSESFIQLVCEIAPAQVTLVPDKPEAITSDAGWDTVKHQTMLRPIIQQFQEKGIRVSLFVDPIEEMVCGAHECGADRIEFYTGPYAHNFEKDPNTAVRPYVKAAAIAAQLGLGINAGHDLSLENLQHFTQSLGNVDEVSIGHALISDSLYLGLEITIASYQSCLQ